LGELIASFEKNGVWAGVIVREVKGSYQLAFGHHRVEAARRLKLGKVPVIVEELSDDQMLQRMAAENSEEYGHDFALGVMNAVEAVVKAYGAGKVELRKLEERVKNSDRRTAPSFSHHEAGKPGDYSAASVAEYLGWTETDTPGTTRASRRVLTALSALELIEKKALTRAQVRGKGNAQVRDMVFLIKRRMDQEEEEREREKAAIEARLKVAQKEENKHQVAKLEEKLHVAEVEAKKEVLQAGKAAAATIAQHFAETKKMATALAKASEELRVEQVRPRAPKAVKEVDLSSVDIFIGRLDNLLHDDDPSWERMLLLAERAGSKKLFNELLTALGNLSHRADLRANELQKALRKGDK
jgi:hypothetical protein